MSPTKLDKQPLVAWPSSEALRRSAVSSPPSDVTTLGRPTMLSPSPSDATTSILIPKDARGTGTSFVSTSTLGGTTIVGGANATVSVDPIVSQMSPRRPMGSVSDLHQSNMTLYTSPPSPRYVGREMPPSLQRDPPRFHNALRRSTSPKRVAGASSLPGQPPSYT